VGREAHGFSSTNKTVYSAKYHLIWCPKYRVLVGQIETRLVEIIGHFCVEHSADVCCLLERDAGAAVEAEFLRSFATGFLTVADLTVADLTRSAELVEQFADLPLGGIDPCLVALVERLPRCPLSPPMPTKPRRWRQGALLERAANRCHTRDQ
jgi:hypothetical protein